MSSKLVYLIIGAILLVTAGVFVLSLPAKNTNPVQKLKEAATPIPIPTIPPGTLFVTSDGIAPSKIEVKVGSALIITNNTMTDATIKMSGALSKDIVAPARKTIKTEIINSSGEVKASLPGSRSNAVTITIK